MVKLSGAAAVTVPRIPLPLPNACLMPSGGPSVSCAGQSCADNIATPSAAIASFAVHFMHPLDGGVKCMDAGVGVSVVVGWSGGGFWQGCCDLGQLQIPRLRSQ